MNRPRTSFESRVAADHDPLAERERDRTASKPAASKLGDELDPASENRARSISSSDGKKLLSQCARSAPVSKVDDRRAVRPAPSTRAASAKARGRSTRWMTSHMSARSNQPSLNGQALGGRDLDRAQTLPRASRHLRLGLDAPDPGAALGERGCHATRAAPDVEHAPSDEVAFADEQLEELPPVLVRRPQLVVAARDPPEIRLVRRRAPRAR